MIKWELEGVGRMKKGCVGGWGGGVGGSVLPRNGELHHGHNDKHDVFVNKREKKLQYTAR